MLPPGRIAPGPLAAYSRVCGFAESGPLPITYPHVLGFPAAMRLMTARDFPLPVLGLVHTWIEITAHRALHPTDALEITVYADGLTPHRRGTEVTMVTEARLAGRLVWESRSGYLSRHATGTTTPPSAPPASPPELPAVAEWRLPATWAALRRRLGRPEPHPPAPRDGTALRLPRHIAHGMWTVARCLAEAGSGTVTGGPCRIRSVRADFRAPVPLPSTVTYAADGTAFQVRGGSRVHLTGSVTREE